MAKMPAHPVILGDQVEVLRGKHAGRVGELEEIDFKHTSAYIYFATIRTEEAGQLTVSSDGDRVNFDDLTFCGVPFADCLAKLHDAPACPADSELLAAVLADPTDDATRLVYADWLDERGDPHAEYLRVQVSLANAIRQRGDVDELLSRERRLRETLSEPWIQRCRRLTTEPRPFDVAELDRELEETKRIATRLHPRQAPVDDLSASKMGGMFLWPSNEPWPTIEFRPNPEYYGIEIPEPGETVSLVPVVQLHLSDFPTLPFPRGTNLCQILWMPVWHEGYGPEPYIMWRDSTQVANPRTSYPECKYDQWLVPKECRLYPEEVVEYADWVHKPTEALQREVKEWTETFNEESRSNEHFWSQCHGCKIGGFPWTNQGQRPNRETGDGRPMELLLSLSSDEIDHCHWGWCAMEDRNRCIPIENEDLTGGFHRFTGGNYFIFIDPDDPYSVKSYSDCELI